MGGCRTGGLPFESLYEECEGWYGWLPDEETRSRRAAVESWCGLAAGTAVDGRVKPSRKAKNSPSDKAHSLCVPETFGGNNNNDNANDCNAPCRYRWVRRAMSASNDSKHGGECENGGSAGQW